MALHKTLVLDANMKESTPSSRGYEDKKRKGNRRTGSSITNVEDDGGKEASVTEGKKRG